MFRRLVPVVAALALAASAAAAPAPSAEAAFEKLKQLAGSWDAEVAGMPGMDVTVSWKVTAGGSAVVETLFEGAPHEMVSVYFIDRGVLRMTHYCAAGNQPRMRYDASKSAEGDLAFVFDGGTNLNPKRDTHIHEGRIAWGPDGVEERWIGWDAGKQADVKAFKLSKRM